MGHTLIAGDARLSLLETHGQWTGFSLAVRVGESWHVMASAPLSLLAYLASDGARHETTLNAQHCRAESTALHLSGEYVDVDGVTWRLAVTFEVAAGETGFLASYRLAVDEKRKALRWIGPSLYAGEGSFGASKDEALFPGLEYLLDDEPSSDTAFAAEQYADRTVPHPYKVTVPLMAVSYEGRGVGLFWDPNQAWGMAWRHPSALFSSPNRVDEGAQNHCMALFAPGGASRWVQDGDREARTPVDIGPGGQGTLSAHLVAVPAGGVMGVVRAWVAANGLPALPDPGHDYRQNVDLNVRSYLDVAWDEEAEGWHHTLSDPWGPRYEPYLANQLWRYGQWAEADPTLRARAREQVRRAVERSRAQAAASTGLVAGEQVRRRTPHLELALVYGHVAETMDSLAAECREAMEAQREDGAWPWKAADVFDVAEFKTDDRLAIMGAETESASGLTAMRVKPVLQYALCTGDRDAVASVLRAADWCNGQRRPEGAQVWELHLHIPDILAVPYLVNLNLAAYQLSGNPDYLQAASRWAWTGLPFTFLWNPYYRPVMRYGTVPVFGVTFHDVQSWFGVIVHWNGLVYAHALRRLARLRPQDGPIDWGLLAEGIVRHGMQEQMTDGPFLGMYPDAFSTVKGDEEYTWWLNPQLVGQSSFPLAGLPVDAETTILRGPDGQAIHLTTGAETVEAAVGDAGAVRALVRHQRGGASFALLAGFEPGHVGFDGAALPQVDDVEAVEQGWQWLPAHAAVLAKLHHRHASGTLVIRPA